MQSDKVDELEEQARGVVKIMRRLKQELFGAFDSFRNRGEVSE